MQSHRKGLFASHDQVAPGPQTPRPPKIETDAQPRALADRLTHALADRLIWAADVAASLKRVAQLFWIQNRASFHEK